MCQACGMDLNEVKKNKFAEQILQHYNGAAITFMISVGHRTKLFDAMDGQAPLTSYAIATLAGLNERYVREWLGVMVTGGVIAYIADDKTYVLPAEHAAWLTRKNAPNNMAVTAQWMPLLSTVEDRVVECFKNGGGLSYSEYGRFHEVMADESEQTVVIPLVETLLPMVPGLKEKLEKGIEVLDVGCGRGRAIITMAQAFPKSRFTGYEFSEEAVRDAREEARRLNLTNVRFEVKDVADFNDTARYDLITTFDAVHDQAKPDVVLRNIYRALKSDGVYFCQDIAGSSLLENNMDHPIAPLLYTISTTHCMRLSLAQGGAGLGTMWGKELATEMMKAAGFKTVELRQLEHDFINYYYIVRK